MSNTAKNRGALEDQPEYVDLDREKRAKPFVKWVGGKGQLVARLHEMMPNNYSRYFEPFLGGGAFFFRLMPSKAFLSDLNDELINTYQVVRDNVEGLIRELSKHRHDQEYFYQVRDWDRRDDYMELAPEKRAARFIFLNKTCFNGLHRVNSKGFFNVPFGDYVNLRILDEPNLRRCSVVLKGSVVRKASYLSIEQAAKSGDFVYFDPPYAPLNATSNFTSYTSSGFSLEDQQELRDLCARLDKKGVLFMLSNSSAPLILDLYNSFNLSLVDAKRSINSKASGRGAVKEVIVTNY